MKKLFVLALAVVMVAAFAMPASALENKFGGYWETVFDSYQNLNFKDDAGTDYSTARSRTRLYYTAVISDNLKFINKFEMDTEWGEQGTAYGDIGADGQRFEIKNTYADFKLANFRWEIGTQGFKINRGFVINDDATGIKVSYRGLDNMIPALWWFRLYNGDKDIANAGADVDHYTALINIKSGNMQFVPSIGYLTANSGNQYVTAGEAMNIVFLGLDFNMKADKFNLEMTGVYEGGELDDNTDISAYALYAKLGFNLGNVGIRTSFTYTTGEEAAATGDYDGFWYPQQNGTGAQFPTSQLVRKGDDWTKITTANTSPGSSPENRMDYNIGVDFKPAKDWKLAVDWYYLNQAEDAASGDSDIGHEFDVKATWNVMKNLDLDLIGAYLIIGDAYETGVDDADFASELSARLRLSF